LFALAVVAGGCAQAPPASPPDNLALGRIPELIGGSGDPARIVDGRLAPEGAPADSAPVSLGGVLSSLTIDLGAPHDIGALLLQVGSADVYFVESSVDGERWRIVWRVAPLPGAGALRTRTELLPRRVSSRWLRVRPTTERSPAIAELQAYAHEPRPYPKLDLRRGDARLPLWPGLTAEKVPVLLTALGALLMLVVAWNVWGETAPTPAAASRYRRGALLLTGVLALLAWPNFLNFYYSRNVHMWDFSHYYLGGKYFRELGYTRLYLCAATADVQDGVDLSGTMMRDLRDDRLVRTEEELKRSGECRSQFSQSRWDAFRHDVRFFRDTMGPAEWVGARNDHGFNAPPSWVLLGGTLADLGPASQVQLEVLASIDLAAILGIVLGMGWGFGFRSACLAAGYFGLNGLSQFGWTGGSLLRNDWILLLVLGLAALRRGRPVLAGFSLAYSALLRVFPGFALLGIAAGIGVEAIRSRSLAPVRARAALAGGVAAAGLVLVGGSVLAAGRPGVWSEFVANSSKHVGTRTTNLVGLPTFLAYRDETSHLLMRDPLAEDHEAAWQARLAADMRDLRPAVAVATLAYASLLVLALLARRPPDWVAAILGLGLVPFVGSLSCYYYSMLLVLAALWRVRPAVALGLACFTWLSDVIISLGASQEVQYAWLSLAVVALVTAVAGLVAAPAEDGTGSAILPGAEKGPEGVESRSA
jgi:hypothetical protein